VCSIWNLRGSGSAKSFPFFVEKVQIASLTSYGEWQCCGSGSRIFGQCRSMVLMTKIKNIKKISSFKKI
jgi:hypothetical protein